MVKSPDGSLRTSLSQSAKMMYEKSKTSKVYNMPVFYEISKYYIPQLLCEMRQYDCDQLLVSGFHHSIYSAVGIRFVGFNIERIECYVNENKKRPTKFTPNK